MAYVLLSFPEPSETFIAEEALSVHATGASVRIVRMRAGRKDVVHPIAASLAAAAPVFDLPDRSGFGQSLVSLARLAAREPVRTTRCLLEALRSKERWAFIQALPAAAWCAAQGIDYVHAHFSDKNLFVAAKIARWLDIPYGVTTHRYDILDDPLPATELARLLDRADLLVTISEFNRRHMADKFHVPPERIHVVHCGIDLKKFAMRPNERSPRGDGPLRLLNVGRLVDIKGQDTLLDAIGLIRSRGVQISLEIIGSGPLREALESQARALGIADVVMFHGAKDEDFVRERLSAADVFVMPSRSEGLPVACMEALAIGTPVIASRIFGIPELIEDGVCGWLIPPNDAEALAAAVTAASQSPASMARFRTAGRSVVEIGFERGRCTRELLSLVAAAIAGHRNSRPQAAPPA